MRYRNKISGSIVRVKDGRTLDKSRWELIGADTQKPAPIAPKSLGEPSYNDLKAEATALGISFKGNISRKELTSMIEAVKSAG